MHCPAAQAREPAVTVKSEHSVFAFQQFLRRGRNTRDIESDFAHQTELVVALRPVPNQHSENYNTDDDQDRQKSNDPDLDFFKQEPFQNTPKATIGAGPVMALA